MASTLDIGGGGALPLFAAGSAVIELARELAAAHSSDADGTCPRCGQPSPCPVATNALRVCAAAGLPAMHEPA